MFNTERYEIMFTADKSDSFNLKTLKNGWNTAAQVVYGKAGIFVNGQFIEREIVYKNSMPSVIAYGVLSTRNPMIDTDETLYFEALREVVNNVKVILNYPFISLSQLQVNAIIM